MRRLALVLICACLIASSECGSQRFAHILEGPFLADSLKAISHDTRIVIRETPNSSTGDWSGNKVWPSSIALLQHIHKAWADKLVGLNVVELGSGLPVLASGLAALGAEVCCTDLLEALPHIESSISKNDTSGMSMTGLSSEARKRIRVRELSWGEESAQAVAKNCGFAGIVDLVIGADLVYDGISWELLRQTLVTIVDGHGAIAVLALQPRGFPLVASLQQQGQVAGFVRSLASRENWDVQVERAGPTRGLLMITATPKGASARVSSVTGGAARKTDWRPVRHFTEEQDGEPTIIVQHNEL